ncbi:hypothetical protein B5F08_05855 [Anaeromassilibacillus sp. An172]|nr:hypothetical protein B5F08_05855 [Anaeromassilibacillus sp. An172]
MVVVDYIKWSEEYMENAEIIKSNIDKIQERIKNAPPEKKSTFYELLGKYRTIYYESLKTAEFLRNRSVESGTRCRIM